jgi:dipeptidyl aminopeptidase/acylaminoacyl peptidase
MPGGKMKTRGSPVGSVVFAGVLVVLLAGAGVSGSIPVLATLDLGDIPARPAAPEFPFERFFATRRLGQVEFAPDNRTLYALRNDGRVANVFAIDLASKAMQQVTHFDEPVSEFFVDPQSRYLITLQDIGGNEAYDLYRHDLASGQVRRLTETAGRDECRVCGLSPDGAYVYYSQTRNGRGAADLWRGQTAGGETTRLYRGDGRLLECEAVSPDGRYLLFAELIGHSERSLALYDINAGQARDIMRRPGANNVDGHFTADGVVFLSAWGADRFRIWRYRFGSRAPVPVRLPFDNDVDVLRLYTGGRVAVVTYRSELAGKTVIFVDGFATAQTFGFRPEEIMDAAFSRENPELGVVATGNATTPLRYYRVGPEGAGLVYDANESGIDNRFFADARSLRVRSFDGLEIPVHLFIPNATSAGRPRAAIVVIHGGPDDHVDPQYLAKVQLLANRGFIVVVPNVRGSSGFGARYELLDNGDWGGAHIRDIVAVAEFVRALDFVDGDNLFVAGASFGGFSVMSLITQYPDTFRAAVNFFGFTELATFVDSWPAYLQRRLFQDLGFDPRVDRERNRARSPLYHVDRIRIPLQVHQGANDRRVPRIQSDRLVKGVLARGGTVEYFVYPDEGHGFSRVENERASLERMVAFLRRHMHRD